MIGDSILTSSTPIISKNGKEVSYFLVWYGEMPLNVEFKMEMSVKRNLMKKHSIMFRKDTEELYSRGKGKIEVVYKLYPKF
jgi:hypothetical protein